MNKLDKSDWLNKEKTAVEKLQVGTNDGVLTWVRNNSNKVLEKDVFGTQYELNYLDSKFLLSFLRSWEDNEPEEGGEWIYSYSLEIYSKENVFKWKIHLFELKELYDAVLRKTEGVAKVLDDVINDKRLGKYEREWNELDDFFNLGTNNISDPNIDLTL